MKSERVIDKRSVPERIEALLTEREVPKRKQRQALADACGISYQAVRQWFTGDTVNILPEHLYTIATRYGSSMEWLVAGAGPMLRKADVQLLSGVDPKNLDTWVSLNNTERQLVFEYAQRLIASRPPDTALPQTKQPGSKDAKQAEKAISAQK